MIRTSSYFADLGAIAEASTLRSISSSIPTKLPTKLPKDLIGQIRTNRLSFFCPSRSLLTSWKNSAQDDDAWAEYERDFWKLMNTRRPQIDAWLESLLPESDEVLLCWEKSDARCHRRLVGKIIHKYRPDCWGGEWEAISDHQVVQPSNRSVPIAEVQVAEVAKAELIAIAPPAKPCIRQPFAIGSRVTLRCLLDGDLYKTKPYAGCLYVVTGFKFVDYEGERSPHIAPPDGGEQYYYKLLSKDGDSGFWYHSQLALLIDAGDRY